MKLVNMNFQTIFFLIQAISFGGGGGGGGGDFTPLQRTDFDNKWEWLG